MRALTAGWDRPNMMALRLKLPFWATDKKASKSEGARLIRNIYKSIDTFHLNGNQAIAILFLVGGTAHSPAAGQVHLRPPAGP
jgi:hypothetical protein